MSLGIELLADPADAELAGPPGATDRGASLADAADAEPADAPATSGCRPLVALGDTRGDGRPPVVRWLDRPPRPGEGNGELLIAPAGDGLWRRAPWPAADPLFDLPPGPAASALLVGSPSGQRDALAERAAARGVPLTPVERLDVAALAGAGCVVFADSPGRALPSRAFAILAARRLLLVPRLSTTFGLEDGLDHLEFADPDEAVTAVEAFAGDPEAFTRVMAWGRLKAEQQRASTVYARLAYDLRVHGLADAA
jgi:hypothetical protein